MNSAIVDHMRYAYMAIWTSNQRVIDLHSDE